MTNLNKQKLYCKLILPNKIEFSDYIIKMLIPSISGEITILANHAPLISKISSGIIEINDIEKKKYKYFVLYGITEIYDNTVILLVEKLIKFNKLNEFFFNNEINNLNKKIKNTKNSNLLYKLKIDLNNLYLCKKNI